MGYSDKPLSEHTLTGTRIRPQLHETHKGQGRVGSEAQQQHVCENSVADKCADSPFSDGTQQVYKCEPTDHSVMAHNKLTSYANKKLPQRIKEKHISTPLP